MLGLLLALIGVSGAWALYRLHDLSAVADTVYRDRIVPLAQLRAISDDYRFIARAVDDHLDGSLADQDALRAIDAAQRRIARERRDYMVTYLLEREKQLIAQAEPLLSRADAVVATLRTALEQRDRQVLRTVALNEMPGAFDPVVQALDRLMDFQLEIATQFNDSVQRAYGNAVWTVGALVLLAAGGGTLLGWAVFLRYESERRAADARSERLRWFFVALSRTNQLIVREHDEQALFEQICRICVDSGRVPFAMIVQADGAIASQTASAGVRPAAWYPLPASWPLDSPQARGFVSTRSILSGAHVIGQSWQAVAGDGQADPRDSVHGRDTAAFPFWRAGKVDGALVLSVDESAFFEDDLIALLDDMAQDISFALDNIDHEGARIAAVQAVQEHEQQLAGILESAMDAIVVFDKQQRILVFNGAASALFGVSVAQALGAPVDRFILPPVEATESERNGWFSATTERCKLCGVRVDGGRFPIEVSVSRTGSPTQPLSTAVIRDLTEQLQAEQARRAQAEAEAANKAKTDFLSRMSHELRTPLNAVMGFSELLRTQAHSRLTSHELAQLEHIHKAGEHLLTLVNDVLDVSRIESGRLHIDARNLELEPVLDEAVCMVEPLARQTGITLSATSSAGAGLHVMADPIRLRQVLINVLSNAVKYNHAGGSVQIEAGAEDGCVRIDVVDTGLGMTREQMSHLYEPFNRLGRERGWTEGAGIGLALSRQLVRLMHGNMYISSEVGSGTRVRLTLPILGASQQATLPSGSAAQHADVVPVGRVLYIEDNLVNLVLVEQMLSRWSGVQLFRAENGRTGIEVARTLRPDLVLLGMQLSDMTAVDVIRALRAAGDAAGPHIVAVSAGATPEEVEQALRCGANDCWTTPLDLDRFLSDVQRLLAPLPASLIG